MLRRSKSARAALGAAGPAIAVVGAAGLFVAACSSSPDEITFTDDGSPAVTVAQTSTTLQSVDLNIDFEVLQDAFRELNDNPAATTTFSVYEEDSDVPWMIYEVSYVPRSQWRHGVGEYLTYYRPNMEAYINLDGDVVMSVQALFETQAWIKNREALESAGLDPNQIPDPADLAFEVRPDLKEIEGFVEFTNYDILQPMFLVEAAPGPLVSGYVIENRIVADNAEIREIREVDGVAEFEVVPNNDEPGRYYVMRIDKEGRIVMVDSRLAGVSRSVVQEISYDTTEESTEPPDYMSADELLAIAGEQDSWLVAIEGADGEAAEDAVDE